MQIFTIDLKEKCFYTYTSYDPLVMKDKIFTLFVLSLSLMNRNGPTPDPPHPRP